MRRGKPIRLTARRQETDFSIVTQYQAEYRGLVQYYLLAFNVHRLELDFGEPAATRMVGIQFLVAVVVASGERQPRQHDAVSRQLEQLISAGLLRREGERPGRRGCGLALTDAGQQHLTVAAQAVQCQLAEWLTDWDDRDLAAFGHLVSRFNQSTSRAYLAG